MEKGGKIDIHVIYQVLNSSYGFLLFFFSSIVPRFCVFVLHLSAAG